MNVTKACACGRWERYGPQHVVLRAYEEHRKRCVLREEGK